MNKLSLESRRSAYKRRYKKTIEDLLLMLPGELKGMEDDVFSPSSAIESTLLHLIREGNALKALLEVEEGDRQ